MEEKREIEPGEKQRVKNKGNRKWQQKAENSGYGWREREIEIEPEEKPRAKNKGRLGYRENVPGKEKDWLQRLISKE